MIERALRTRSTQALSFEDRRAERRIAYEARLTPCGHEELLVLVRDVTDRRVLEEQLRRQAYTDPLTGLANRALLRDRITEALTLCRRECRPTSVPVLLLIDLDDFKAVNDTLGHPAGDRLLRVVAARLRGHAREGDTVARLGGDEFAVLLRCADAERGAEVAQRMLDSLRPPVHAGGRIVRPRASVGVAVAGSEIDGDGLLRNADMAMYEAKRAGKHRWAAFRPELRSDLLDRLALEADLRDALTAAQDDISGTGGSLSPSGGRLEVHFQPIVDLAAGRIDGFEALLRWTHPRRGAVSPAAFVPVAEETGLIDPLGKWVLQRACRQAAAWASAGHELAPWVSVNLSARQLEDPRLHEEVRDALATSGLAPQSLVLEVTETALIGQGETAAEALHAFRAMGVRTAIDDFGTGYSSLSRLRELPVDLLKIDKAFVAEVCDAQSEAPIAGAIVELGRALGLEVVAEGIEHEGQAAGLKALGARYGQGYLLGRPMGAEQATERLARAVPAADSLA